MAENQSTLLGLPLELRLTIFRAVSDEFQTTDFLACDHACWSQESGRKFNLPINALLNLRLTCLSINSEINKENPPINLKSPTLTLCLLERSWEKEQNFLKTLKLPKVVLCSGLCVDPFMQKLTCLGRLSVQDMRIDGKHKFAQQAQASERGLRGSKVAGHLLLHDNRHALTQELRKWKIAVRHDHIAESYFLRDTAGNIRYTWVNQYELWSPRHALSVVHHDWQRNKRFLYPSRENERCGDMHQAIVRRDLAQNLKDD